MDCIHRPLCNKLLLSVFRWKEALEDGLLLMKAIRSSLNLKGDIVFTRDMSMECVIAAVFGHQGTSP